MKKLVKIFLVALLVSCTSETGYNYESVDGMGGVANVRTGWSQSGNLSTRNRNQQVTCAANFRTRESFTVQFNVDRLSGALDPDSGLRMVSRPQAEVQWSVDGNTIYRKFDVFEGTSLSGQGEAVKVRLYDGSQDPTIGPNVAPNIKYGGTIQVTKGLRASEFAPTLQAVNWEQSGTAQVTYGRLSVGAFSPAIDFPIPQYSGIQSFYYSIVPRGTPSEDHLVLLGANSAGVQGPTYPVDKSGEWHPLPAGATDIRFLNASSISYDIAIFFGVDG